MVSARLKAGGGICKDIKWTILGIFYVFCFHHAVSIQVGYPLESVLVIWSERIRASLGWDARGRVATVDDGRSGSLGVIFRLLGRLLVLFADVLGGSRATRGRLGRFLVAFFYM